MNTQSVNYKPMSLLSKIAILLFMAALVVGSAYYSQKQSRLFKELSQLGSLEVFHNGNEHILHYYSYDGELNEDEAKLLGQITGYHIIAE